MAFERKLWEERERRWFVLKRPRRNINGGSETEVTVTSKRHAQAGRAKRCKREEKPASIGGAARDPGQLQEEEGALEDLLGLPL